MLVKESISFQRGADPKDTLGIGEKHLLYKPSLIEISEKLLKKYKDFLAEYSHIYENPRYFEVAFYDVPKNNSYYLGYDTYAFIFRWYNKTGRDGDEEYYENLKDLEERVIQVLDFDSHIKIEESISFQRGGDPKEILGIGYERKFHVKEILDALDLLLSTYKDPSEIKIHIQNENEFAAGFDWLEKRPYDILYWRYLLGYNKEGFYTSSYEKLSKSGAKYKRTIHAADNIKRCIDNIETWLYQY